MSSESERLYGEFIAISRYARWMEKPARRETWKETVDRYVDYVSERNERLYPGTVSKVDWEKIRKAIFNLEIMPSMRGLMTAGPALEREPLAIYNCSFLAVNDTRAFDEALYILMNGVGMGFSVEEKHVSELPVIASEHKATSDTVVVEDSKEGWATAFRELIDHLYAGRVPAIDITKVRAAGAPLKTFGGRASGPQPLVNLFDFTVETFKNAAGRKLTPLEAHDIMCKVGEVVVVGGVRRSALISLSDLDSYEMSKAKSGAWWINDGQRALANNSAVYNKKPGIGEFMREWGSLYESKSGERGIFNMEQALKGNGSPRRDASQIAGTNPCGEILLRNGGLCNLTEIIVKEHDTEETLAEKARLTTILGTVQSTFTQFGYLRDMWQRNAEEERLLGVSMTGQFGNALMSGRSGKRALKAALLGLKNLAIEVNEYLSGIMGISQSAAITTVKPSGTVSQLTHSSAGMHAWHSQFYLRTVRGDKKDPLSRMMIDYGIPNEPDVTKPDDTVVFTFPIAAPAGAVTRKDLTAIEHLEAWLMYKKYWTEHNPSVTISVKEDEWIEVANWVYTHWEHVGGLSFLPYEDHVYQQAPYQECDETTYKQFVADMPKSIDWNMLSAYELEDTTAGTQSLSCTSGACELVNIGA